MGADMIVALVAHKKNAKIDFEAGKPFLEKWAASLDLTDQDVINSLVEEGMDENECLDENDKLIPEKVYSWVEGWIDEFKDALHGRDVACLHVRDLMCYLVGGMSWGDAPEGCTAYWRMSVIPGLLASMGFEEHWDEVDPTVTPDEEAAAIQSIKGVAS